MMIIILMCCIWFWFFSRFDKKCSTSLHIYYKKKFKHKKIKINFLSAFCSIFITCSGKSNYAGTNTGTVEISIEILKSVLLEMSKSKDREKHYLSRYLICNI